MNINRQMHSWLSKYLIMTEKKEEVPMEQNNNWLEN